MSLATAPARHEPTAQLTLAEVAALERNVLPDEVARYLAAVDEYRRLGSAPTWRPEGVENGYA